MEFDFDSLEPLIYRILSRPGTDLTTITAKVVRRQLHEEDPSLSHEFLTNNKKTIGTVIAKVFLTVNTAQEAAGSQDDIRETADNGSGSRKRKQDEDEKFGGEVVEDEDDKKAGGPLPKKARKVSKKDISGDAELARQLSDELNGRSRRTSAKPRGNSNGTGKKGGRAKKSAAVVDSDVDSDADDSTPKRVKKPRSGGGGGAAKGGFAKEYSLSEPLAALLSVEKLSRPQVVKHLWIHIKDNGLQNPNNKREIMCDDSLRAIFGVDKIDMFRMNKVLGQHLHENAA